MRLKVFELVPGAYEVCDETDYATGGVCVASSREYAEEIAKRWNAAELMKHADKNQG